MKNSPSVLSVFAATILLVVPQALSAQESATLPQTSPVQRPPGIVTPAVQGYALGGPVGVLTDLQRTSYEVAMTRQRARMLELQSQLRAARQDFVVASVDQKFDENVMRQKAMAAYRIDAEMAVLRVKAMSEVQPPLTPEQIEKIKASQPGPARPLRPGQQLENAAPRNPAVKTNGDLNGLPPKR